MKKTLRLIIRILGYVGMLAIFVYAEKFHAVFFGKWYTGLLLLALGFGWLALCISLSDHRRRK